MTKVKAATNSRIVECAFPGCEEKMSIGNYANHVAAKHSILPVTPAPQPEPPPQAAFTPFNLPTGGHSRPPVAGGFQPSSVGNQVGEMAGPINADDYGKTKFLKGADFPEGQTEGIVRIKRFVTIPGAQSPLVCEIEPLFDKLYLPLNKTNIQELAKHVGKDLRAVINRQIKLMVYPQFNPRTQQMGKAIFVSGVQ